MVNGLYYFRVIRLRRKLIMRQKRMTGRKCYDHLGGNLGEALLNFYIENGWIELEEGKSTIYIITEKGYAEFEKMGLHVEPDML